MVAASATENPFIPISDAHRFAVVVYFLFWRLIPTVVLAPQAKSDSSYALAIALVAVTTELLILLPFLLKRFAGTPIGWLHPLILPTVVGAVFGLLRSLGDLLLPIAIWSQSAPVLEHALLVGWPELAILEAQLKLNLINLLALVCTYAGFMVLRSPQQKPAAPPITLDGFKLALVFVPCLLIVLFFLQQQGGIIAHMSTLGGGRFRMRELSGQFLVINSFLPYLVLIWYAHRPDALRNPLFVVAFVLASLMQFVVTGSRSSLFMPSAVLLAIWIFHNRRLPAGRTIALGMVAVLLIGVLGEVRRSGRDGEVDFTALIEFDIASALKMTDQEQEARRRYTGLAIAALVPDSHAHLWGTTYIAAAAFWVPRFLWPDKPRGAGAHASALLFGGRDTMDDYQGGGYPVNGAPEAYWNFSYPGVIVVFLLYGMLLCAVARWLMRDPKNPFALLTLLIILFMMNTPNTTSIVPTLQSSTLLYAVYLLAGRLQLRR